MNTKEFRAKITELAEKDELWRAFSRGGHAANHNRYNPAKSLNRIMSEDSLVDSAFSSARDSSAVLYDLLMSNAGTLLVNTQNRPDGDVFCISFDTDEERLGLERTKNGDIIEKSTRSVNAVFIKDSSQPFGVKLHTFYPWVSDPRAVATGRDISPYLFETFEFNKSSAAKKAYWLAATDPKLAGEKCYIEGADITEIKIQENDTVTNTLTVSSHTVNAVTKGGYGKAESYDLNEAQTRSAFADKFPDTAATFNRVAKYYTHTISR